MTIWEKLLVNMLFRQCENLHKLAADADMEKDTRHFRDPLLEAANTIMVLHDELHAENDKLRELVREAIYARDDADWASIVSTAIALGVEVDE